jgi:hypothetical protein
MPVIVKKEVPEKKPVLTLASVKASIPSVPIVVPPNLNTSLFSNNNYYKPHSLSSGGIGTVRNHHSKGKKT